MLSTPALASTAALAQIPVPYLLLPPNKAAIHFALSDIFGGGIFLILKFTQNSYFKGDYMETISAANKSAGSASVYTPNCELSVKCVSEDDKKYDEFIRSVDSYINEQRRQQKLEEKIAKQNAADMAARKRRMSKLLLKKHNDYLRFLEGTALKRSIAERERIRDPHLSETEIDADSDAVTDAVSPLFIRI